MKKIVFATTNPGKFAMVKDIFMHHGIQLLNPTDLDVKIEVEETGNTLEENARLKAEAYANILPADCVVIGDDTGIEIDSLDGEPGIKVRRWKGYEMEDEEIITYCLDRLKDMPVGQRGAQFRTVLTVTSHGSETKYFDGVLRGEILEKPLSLRSKGMPFWPIFYIPQLKMTLGEFHAKPIEFQIKNPTHRELAVLKVLPYLATLNQ
jgi:XTP/dITP diphosphohydrolase